MFSRFRALDRIWDVFISVELSEIWRLHLVYGKTDGEELIRLFIHHFAALSTMLTLLIAAQTGVLFSPSRPAETARTALEQKQYQTMAFWAGLVLCLGIVSSILALLATLTAWSIFSVTGKMNARVLLRSSLFLHAAALPARLSQCSIYIFFLWVNLFWYVICAVEVAAPLSILCGMGMLYIITTFSAVARVVMYSGAISDQERILEREKEEELSPFELTEALIDRAVVAKEGAIPVNEQYRIRYQEQLHILEAGGSLQLDELRLAESQRVEEAKIEVEEKSE